MEELSISRIGIDRHNMASVNICYHSSNLSWASQLLFMVVDTNLDLILCHGTTIRLEPPVQLAAIPRQQKYSILNEGLKPMAEISICASFLLQESYLLMHATGATAN
jgi:hypothetical protein